LDLSFSKHLNVVQAEAGGNFLGGKNQDNSYVFLNRVFESKRMMQMEKKQQNRNKQKSSKTGMNGKAIKPERMEKRVKPGINDKITEPVAMQ